MHKLCLIDSDGLIYHSLRDSLQESLSIIDEKILNIFEKTGATHYVLFISQGKYFRHNLFPEYKISREKYRNNPSSKWVKVLKQYLIANWNAQWMDNVEADDLVTYWMNNPIYYGKFTNPHSDSYWMFCNHELVKLADEYQQVEKVICSPDKDILESISGKHFNYSYKLEDKDNPNSVVKGWWVETTQEDATDFYGKQLLMGDSADGIPALNGVGEARATKILQNWQDGMLETFILDYYIEYYKGDVPKAIFEFQKTHRLLHMLDCDEDFIREVGKLPNFPEIQSVNKQSVEPIVIPEF